jgi:hypothetical protein
MDFDSLPEVPGLADIRTGGTIGDYVKRHEWQLAFHESAHIVAEVLLNQTYPDLVYLNDGLSNGPDHFARTQGDRQFPDPKVYGNVAAAGVLGPLLACADEPDVFQLAVSAVDSTGRDELEIFAFAGPLDDYLGWAEARYNSALECVRTNWPVVAGIARALVRFRRLTAEDLRTIVEHYSTWIKRPG